MADLGITLAGQPFDHLMYHFVLTYSNWETCTVCFSESFESLAKACRTRCGNWAACPAEHRTDRLSAAVNNLAKDADQQRRSPGDTALLGHYGLAGQQDPGGQGQRERGCRAASPPVQAGPGSGVDVARQPGLCQPR